MQHPGTITLMGSGETSTSGGQVFEALAQEMQPPVQISVLETPAGFEANASRVAGRVADFLKVRLQNYRPQLNLVQARKKGTPFSPDLPEIVAPLYESQMIFFGPGSPTYTVRQLENSLAWHILQARQRLGASLVLASAATIAMGTLALPVYEIFKAGEDPHWKPGLDFFQPYGLSIVIIPHWNNHEGGEDVDTSRCFMGQERFAALQAMLPKGALILGLDEHTSITIDFQAQVCQVRGVGQIHILRETGQKDYSADQLFSIRELGAFHPLRAPEAGLPEAVWKQALAVEHRLEQTRTTPEAVTAAIPPEVQQLVAERQAARVAKDWGLADQIRGKIANLGWQVKDTPTGPVIRRED